MNYEVKNAYKAAESQLKYIIQNFESEGIPFGNQDRNSLKLFTIEGELLNVKSFRIPNFINRVAYRFFRKSKAQRSFEYANKLVKLGIGTPEPIAYFEFATPLFFNKSFYISQQLECDLTYRELTKDFNYPNHEQILRAFTRFTFELHEKGVHFLDHSPGNTLIVKERDTYQFFLVDLNRMEFKTLDFETRIKNFAKLTVHKSMIQVMSDEYAKCIDADYDKVFDMMWKLTCRFQKKYHNRRKLKKALKFWKR